MADERQPRGTCPSPKSQNRVATLKPKQSNDRADASGRNSSVHVS
jgi:hypothetical protein